MMPLPRLVRRSADGHLSQEPGAQGEGEDPTAPQGPPGAPLPAAARERDSDLAREARLCLGDAQGALPGEAEAGDSTAPGHEDSN